MIELRAISEDNFRECLLLRASVENEDFVDPVTYSLAEAWVYYQDTRPFAIYSDDTIVGFVSMYVGEDNYQIINFLIDDAFQRKGYGSKAVKLCIEYLQREFSACRISAPVKMEHIAAQEFWIKQGFCLSDTIEDGYVFMRLFLLDKKRTHALQYLHPESFDGLIARSRLYVIQYDGTCYKLVDGEWKECKKKSAFRNRNAGIKISPKTEVFGEFLLFFDSTVVFGLVRCGFFLFFGMFFILFLCPLFSGFYAL